MANAVQKKTAVNFPCLAHVEDVSGGSRTYKDRSVDSNSLVSALPIYGAAWPDTGSCSQVCECARARVCVSVCVCVCVCVSACG